MWLITMLLLLLAQEGKCPRDVAAFLSMRNGDVSYNCVVKYIDDSRTHSMLYVYDALTDREVLNFDPSYNYMLRAYALDVNADGVPDLVSEWTHGNALQVTIHSLAPKPVLMFHKIYRFAISFVTVPPELETKIVVVSGEGVQGPYTSSTYIWSRASREFVVKETRNYPSRD